MFIHTMKILYHTIICKNRELIVRKYYRKEIIEFLGSIIIRMLRTSFQSDFYCRSSSVMTVCNIYRRNLSKLLCDRCLFFLAVDHPCPVSDPVISRKIVDCFM